MKIRVEEIIAEEQTLKGLTLNLFKRRKDRFLTIDLQNQKHMKYK